MWPEEDSLRPCKAGGPRQGPLNAYIQGVTGEEGRHREEIKAKSFRLLSSLWGGMGSVSWEEPNEMEARLIKRREKARPGPPLQRQRLLIYYCV